MDENPYKAPAELGSSSPEKEDEGGTPLTWGAVGFTLGTMVISPLVLSVNRIDRIIYGAIFGGIPAGLCFFQFVASKRRKER